MNDLEDKIMDILLPHWRLEPPYNPLPTTIKQNIYKTYKLVKLIKEEKLMES